MAINQSVNGKGYGDFSNKNVPVPNIMRDFRNAPLYIHCFFPQFLFKDVSFIIFYPLQNGPLFAIISITSFVDLLCFCSVLCFLCLCARLFIRVLWSPTGKGLTSWLWFVVSNCEFVTFPLVSWVRCGT